MWDDRPSRTEKRRTLVLAMTCLALELLATPFRPGIVLGQSMAPTFHSGQVFLSSPVDDPSSLRQGDVVLVTVSGQVLLKRIHAVAGEKFWAIAPEDKALGQLDRILSPSELLALRQAAVCPNDLKDVVRVTVPEGCVFLLGDSPDNSLDSRHFGPVAASDVRGRVVVAHLFSLWADGSSSGSTALAREPLR